MSQHDHDHEHGEDNHAAAYAPSDLPPLPPTPEHGFWRSLRELEGQASFQTDRRNNELPPAPDVHDASSLTSRRNFFQLMGASMALAGVAGCRRYEKEEIVPLARRPENQIPGATLEYATALDLGGVGHAVVATSFEGRPIKIDGNPVHPFASGGIVPGTVSHAGSSTFAQASVLNLYDPDRSKEPVSGGKTTSMEAFKNELQKLRSALGNGNQRTAILTEATSSPTVAELRKRLSKQYPDLEWYEYEPLSWDNERAGMKLAFGKMYRPIAHLDKCETIVTIDADIFVDHPASLRYSRDFAKSRRRNGSLGIGKMNRLWSIESSFTHTGAMADHRLALRSELCLPIVLALDNMVGGKSPIPGNAAVLKDAKVRQFLEVLASELNGNKTRAVVVAGRRQPPEVHAVVARINEALGAGGQTLDYYCTDQLEAPHPGEVSCGAEVTAERRSHASSILALRDRMKGDPGKAGAPLRHLFIIGGNPAYDAPADVDFANLLKSFTAGGGVTVHLSEYNNETSQNTSWHVPRAHYLEAWGDARTWDGTITMAQPLIAPLYGGISTIELYAWLLGDDRSAEQLVQATHNLADVEKHGTWRQAIHDGYLHRSTLPIQTPPPAVVGNFVIPPLTKTQQLDSNPKLAAGGGEGLEITFQVGSHAYDGRFANNAWLQETPDFLSKVTWDNYALVGPETATALGIANDTMIKVSVGGREVELACYTMPGQARSSICLLLGGGRTHAGRVGGDASLERRVGWNTYKVRTAAGADFIVGDVKVVPAGGKYELASVQEHWDIRTGISPKVNQEGIQERLPDLIKMVRHAQLEKYAAWNAETASKFDDKGNLIHDAEQYWDDAHVNGPNARHQSLFKEHTYNGHKWAMAIDLTTCTGCNACHIACQAENNIPVVGRKEIHNNREMSWIRIDRYFSGPPDDPVVAYQPVACQQCENAPCEQVCPVGATQHSDEGLNDMAYNRCIGTRYCANNCPYKVRRFNFLDWNKEWREARNKVRRLLFNPEVTVRMRGVMEKCTFCVQRIQNTKIHVKAQVRQGQRTAPADGPPDGIHDGEIVTACQAACPTEAIVFGDLADKKSRVYRMHEDRRQYSLLPETYTKPRNRYLARVRNPHPRMPSGGAAAPAAAAPAKEGGEK